jgi:hypothetical protein
MIIKSTGSKRPSTHFTGSWHAEIKVMMTKGEEETGM